MRENYLAARNPNLLRKLENKLVKVSKGEFIEKQDVTLEDKNKMKWLTIANFLAFIL